jgi:hypothetical protein
MEVMFGAEQYIWHPDGPASYADPDDPPISETVQGGDGRTYTLPRASIAALGGRVETLQTSKSQ